MRACGEGGASIEQALRELDRSFFVALYRDCQRSIRDAETARDLVQETFIRVWQRCGSYRGESELLPWIRSILRHRMLDHLRGPERDLPLEVGEGIREEVQRGLSALSERSIPSPEDEVRRHQADECFQRCWRRFESAAPVHAAVMAWIAEDGLGHDEIAELLGRTPGATREFISQCRKKARVHLAEWYELAFGTR